MHDDPHAIHNPQELAKIYPEPKPLVVKANHATLTDHDIAYLKAAPFVAIATVAGAGQPAGLNISPRGDAPSPRGDAPGVVHIIDRQSLALPDWPGNNKIETLRNLIADNRVGLLFLFPGLDIFLRIRGRAWVTRDPALMAALEHGGKQPRSIIRVAVENICMHCGKAARRGRLWDPKAHLDAASLPGVGEMIEAAGAAGEQSAREIDAGYAQSMDGELY